MRYICKLFFVLLLMMLIPFFISSQSSNEIRSGFRLEPRAEWDFPDSEEYLARLVSLKEPFQVASVATFEDRLARFTTGAIEKNGIVVRSAIRTKKFTRYFWLIDITGSVFNPGTDVVGTVIEAVYSRNKAGETEVYSRTLLYLYSYDARATINLSRSVPPTIVSFRRNGQTIDLYLPGDVFYATSAEVKERFSSDNAKLSEYVVEN